MDVVLKQAPELFFDQEQWHQFCARFETRDIALARISSPPYDLLGFHREGDTSLPASKRARERHVEATYRLGIGLVGAFKTKLIDGEIEASGIPPLSYELIPIAAEEWSRLWPEFADDCAMGTTRFDEVRVDRSGNPRAQATALSRALTAWLRQRALNGNAPKKILSEEARRQFGSAVTVRYLMPPMRPYIKSAVDGLAKKNKQKHRSFVHL
jgi:hypothetical protein